jgi:putative peptide zinc metalloprotease protein
MTATVDTPTSPVEAPQPGVLDRAEGIELLGDVAGSGYKEGAALVRRPDGQMVQLGPLMYALLENVDGERTTAELAETLSDQLGRACEEEHVVALAQKLAAQGLLAGTEHKAPPRPNPLLALRWKVLVTNPRVTRWLTAPFTIFFRPWVMWPVVASFGAVFWFVLFHKGVASATSDAFRNPALLLLVLALAIVSAGFHELGHAAACRYSGASPGGMGMGLYMVWPAFYTDVTDSYRLPKRDRLRVDLGGIYFNAVVSVATLAFWLAWHVDALLLLIALQLLMMVKNLSPVIRSDGYHILADATGVPDLYAHMLPTLRRLLPGHRREPSASRHDLGAHHRAGAAEHDVRRGNPPAATDHDGMGQRSRDRLGNAARRSPRRPCVDRSPPGALAPGSRQRAHHPEDRPRARGQGARVERGPPGAPRCPHLRNGGRGGRHGVGIVACRPVPARSR